MNTYGVNMGFTNTLESNVIVGKDNGILINVTSDDNKMLIWTTKRSAFTKNLKYYTRLIWEEQS